ncbi:NfeD family protein [Oceanobacillus polygoni]|uniref:Membrane-bound ClpP family serine protease n=1 Tax=Oceanobacillus polygoni TaxID=1235259 RepID=A0A9X0YSQ8_9BACI|nr:NfeD family protein [Oceanobacillus polygoni]MBP2078180.1 membrane-bound ClpP family serine protease [Oceanobacillus polygoni]
MDIFDLQWIGFVITFLATLFLIGEVLVNMRGFFGLLGIGFITVYFAAYVGSSSFILMLIIYFVGLLLIIVDGKLLNDGTLATIGLASMLTSVAIAADDLTSGLYAVLGVLLGTGASFFFLKVFKRREMWTKLALKDQLTKEAGYNSMNMEYEQLVGKEGITLNDLRPVGTVKINNKDYSAVSDGQWIPKNSKVKVTQVDGTKILVEKIA